MKSPQQPATDAVHTCLWASASSFFVFTSISLSLRMLSSARNFCCSTAAVQTKHTHERWKGNRCCQLTTLQPALHKQNFCFTGDLMAWWLAQGNYDCGHWFNIKQPHRAHNKALNIAILTLLWLRIVSRPQANATGSSPKNWRFATESGELKIQWLNHRLTSTGWCMSTQPGQRQHCGQT